MIQRELHADAQAATEPRVVCLYLGALLHTLVLTTVVTRSRTYNAHYATMICDLLLGMLLTK